MPRRGINCRIETTSIEASHGNHRSTRRWVYCQGAALRPLDLEAPACAGACVLLGLHGDREVEHAAFGFWLGDLLKIDTKNEQAMGDFGCLRELSDLPSDKEIARLIKAAMKLHDAGAKLPSREKPEEKKELGIPAAFMAAVKKNKKALATFDAFPPSKKKEYVEWFTEAKTDATRDRRLAQAIEWMAEGKSRHWKYQNC